MRVRGFVNLEEAKNKGSLEALKGEVKLVDGKWVLDENTGSIVRMGCYHVPGFVVGVNTGVKGGSLSHLEHLTPRHQGRGGPTNPDPNDPNFEDPFWAMVDEIRAVREAQKLNSLWHEARNHKCGIFIWAKCGEKHCGTRVISRVPCKREWCPYCGKEQSYFHLIYYYKILHYAYIMFMKNGGKLGYLVITTTPELRQQFLEDPKKMHAFREDIKEKLKELGYKYGIWRWHFAGDEGRTWYPHLNVLIPEGYMPDENLNKLKRWIEKKYGVKVVNYEWTEELGKVKHWARYIARPTWNLQEEADPEKFKGMRKYGIWGNKHFKDLEGVLTETEVFALALALVVEEEKLKRALEELETGNIEQDLSIVLYLLKRGYCPKCGGKVKWEFVGFSGWGVLQGLRAGELHRIGWNTWVYIPKEGPPPDDEEEEIIED
jgi:hypothetical protein